MLVQGFEPQALSLHGMANGLRKRSPSVAKFGEINKFYRSYF